MILAEAIRLTRETAAESADTVLVRVESLLTLEPAKKPRRAGAEIDPAKMRWKAVTDTVCSFEMPLSCLCYDQTPDTSIQSWKNFAGPASGWPYYNKGLTDQGEANRTAVLQAAVNFVERDLLKDWAFSKGICLVVIHPKQKIKLDTLPPTGWPLPVLGGSSKGLLIMGVCAIPQDPQPGIDWDASAELGQRLLKQEEANPQLDSTLHCSSGIGRNAFFDPDFRAGVQEEQVRIWAYHDPALDRVTCTRIIQGLPRWPVPLAPDPKTSRLVFVPHDANDLSPLQDAIQTARELKDRFFKAPKARPRPGEEKIEEKFPGYLPDGGGLSAKVIAGYQDGTQRKWITLDLVQEVPVEYWWALEWVLTKHNAYRVIRDFTKQALAGTTEGKDYPIHLKFWTEVFSRCLHARSLSALPFWNLLPAFNRSMSTDRLIGSPKEYPQGAQYLRVIQTLQDLQFVIRNRSRRWGSEDDSDDFFNVFNSTDRTSLSLMTDTQQKPASAEVYLPEVWGQLTDRQKDQMNAILKLAWAGIPEAERRLYFRGAFAGLALKDLAWSVTEAGRSFNLTSGMHATNMRGKSFIAPFVNAASLAQNEPDIYVPGYLLALVTGMHEESRSNAFNQGFITGLAYRNGKKQTT